MLRPWWRPTSSAWIPCSSNGCTWLMFVLLGSRRVLSAACRSEPNAAWVAQQARNLSWQLEEEGIKLTLVIHDHDRKFPGGFDSIFRSDGARVILTPLMAPRANSHAERWIGSCRRECLDWMLIVSEGHLRRVLHEYVLHYNDERPHRSRDLRPPSSLGDPARRRERDTINRRERLGGLVGEYYAAHEAA